MVQKYFKSILMNYMKNNDNIVKYAGMRYGSILYIGLGKQFQINFQKSVHQRFECEIEFGADQWEIYECDLSIIESNFSDIDSARDIISLFLVGRRIVDLQNHGHKSILMFDNGIEVRSLISQNPSSNFTYCLDIYNEDAIETIDGVFALSD